MILTDKEQFEMISRVLTNLQNQIDNLQKQITVFQLMNEVLIEEVEALKRNEKTN